MKALSIWQPWASLVAIGAKKYETRSWVTAYRGPLVIHAAKRPDELDDLTNAITRLRPSDREEIHTYRPGTFYYHAIKSIYDHEHRHYGAIISMLPLGAALCVVDLVDCIRVEKIRASLSVQERAFGDYTDGRYAWKLANIRKFAEPIPMRGAQGLFECSVPLKSGASHVKI